MCWFRKHNFIMREYFYDASASGSVDTITQHHI